MISGYHQPVAEHYEKYPYPSYPWYGVGGWKQLETLNVNQWGLRRPAKDLWIVGCGAMAPLMFGRRNPQLKILATDLSKSTLAICQQRLRLFGIHNVFLQQHDLLQSGFGREFDAIDAYGVIHHTVSPEKSLSTLASALKPGGILRLMVYSEKARAEIESLRYEIVEEKIKDLDKIEARLKSKKVPRRGDLKSRVGVADALLNPIVHTFNENSLSRLLGGEESLDVVRIDDRSNYVAFLKKI